MNYKHSRIIAAKRHVWFVERLWYLARTLPVQQMAIDQIAEFDQDCWFGANPATCRAVADHARRIFDANLDYPILLSADGYLIDGGHRIAKAYLLQMTTIAAVQFVTDPEPDYILPPNAPMPSVALLPVPETEQTIVASSNL